jgi:hypothetical protein
MVSQPTRADAVLTANIQKIPLSYYNKELFKSFLTEYA